MLNFSYQAVCMPSDANFIVSTHFFQALKQCIFIDKILLYGSRARGDAAERSDIDLAIVCPKATHVDWLHVLNIVEEADTLLKIDCIRYDTLSPLNSLKKAIDDEAIILYKKE